MLKSVIASFLVHAVLIVVLALIVLKAGVVHEVIINFIGQPVEIGMEPQPAPEAQQPKPEVTTEERPPVTVSEPPVAAPATGETIAVSSPTAVDTTAIDSAPVFSARDFFVTSPFVTYKTAIDSMGDVEADSLASLRLDHHAMHFSFDSTQLKASPGPYDPIGEAINTYNKGGTKSMPVGLAASKGAKYLADLFNKNKNDKPVRFDFIPSRTEIAVLEVLWENPHARDHEIYTSLDSTFRLTATDLNHVLERLTQKGIVTRKLVSPRNELTTPVGMIEMSPTNRRNRVYAYQSRVSAEEVLRYLQAVLYQQQTRAKVETKTQQLESLREKILRVASHMGR